MSELPAGNKSERASFKATLVALACISTAVSQAGCKKEEPPKPPPPAVTVTKPVEQEVMEWDEYPGNLVSPHVATVVARVSGLIEQAPFEEGALVKQGDLLFVIDERPFQADLSSKRAAVARAQAQQTQAQVLLKRYESIRDTKAISAQDFDQAAAAAQAAKADLQAAQAAEDISKLNLSWTRVTAPISGRIGRKAITEGNLVNGGSGTPSQLTTITSIDPIYAYMNVPERAFLKYQKVATEARTSGGGDAKIPCAMQLENETDYPHKGVIDFVDNRIDPTTGTIEMRCLIPNPTGNLTQGLFARTRVPGSKMYRTLMVPDVAIGTDQGSRFVLVAGPDDTIKSQPVKLGPVFGKLHAVTDGLKGDERVVIKGNQAARPGTKVTPTEVTMEQAIAPPTPTPSPTPPPPANASAANSAANSGAAK